MLSQPISLPGLILIKYYSVHKIKKDKSTYSKLKSRRIKIFPFPRNKCQLVFFVFKVSLLSGY